MDPFRPPWSDFVPNRPSTQPNHTRVALVGPCSAESSGGLDPEKSHSWQQVGSPGPQIETLWDTPTGQVTLRLDHGLKLESTTEVPSGLPEGRSFPWAPSLVLGLILILGGGLGWIRQRPKGRLKRWSKRAKSSQPPKDAPWPVWETWLGELVQSARKLSDTPTTINLVALLDNARFGIPFNDFWKEVIRKMPS